MKENKVSTNGDGKLALAIIVLLLVIDQAIKIWVKTHMCIGESIHIADWFQILFIENNGMAYGMTFFNKLVLSLFRLVAIGAIGYYLWRLVHREHRRGYVVCMAMVLAGASGNLFDSMFYGLVFDNSSFYSVSHFVPFGTGYADFLYGKVVDMFYFPLFQWNGVPRFLNFLVDSNNYFFGAIFNLADAYISVAVIYLLLFQYKFLSK